MTRHLAVWWGKRIVGDLMQDRHGDLSFTYAADWVVDSTARALSVSLPKRLEPYNRRACRSFFGGLLPEGPIRQAAAAKLGVSPQNDFMLLDRLGGDVAGALQFLPPGEVPPGQVSPGASAVAANLLNDDELAQLLDELPARPLLAGEDGLRLSLAGVQMKLPVLLLDNHIALPRPGQATTHLLKPPIPRFLATTENEALMMRLAAAVGLTVAPVEARVVRGRPFLLVQRYDRAIDPVGDVHRLHQEDFCQALGVASELKYAQEGGPTHKDCFDLVRRVSARPALDMLMLFDAAIFNLIIGNADAHGKNFSILYAPTGVRLAPFYDLLSTCAYPDLSPKMAMKIADAATLRDLDLSVWHRFADEIGLGRREVTRRIARLCDKVRQQIPPVAETLTQPGLGEAEIQRFATMIKERAEMCAATISA